MPRKPSQSHDKQGAKEPIILIAIAVVLFAAAGFFLLRGASRPSGPSSAATTTVQGAVGGQTDGHGCLVAAGYSWCEALGKCIRQWEEDCTAAGATETTLPPALPESPTTSPGGPETISPPTVTSVAEEGPSYTDKGFGGLEIRVFDASTRATLYDATVFVTDSAGKPVVSLGTQAGTASFVLLVGGYSANATALGYKSVKQPVIVSEGVNRQISIGIGKRPPG